MLTAKTVVFHMIEQPNRFEHLALNCQMNYARN